MIPENFKNFLPGPLLENLDENGQALIDFLNNFSDEILQDILGILYFKYPERTAISTLSGWENYFSVTYATAKTERQRRIAISNAVRDQKNRGLWKAHIKIIIDTIAGGDSQIIEAGNTADWILGGDGVTIPTNSYYATLGIDGIDDQLGIDLLGEGNEIEIIGNIYIDVDNSALTQDQIDEMVAEITNDIIPAYFIINLGYISGGNFVPYTTI